MTPFAAATITSDRLKKWARRNQREELTCTPAVLVNIDHNAPPDTGKVFVVNTVENLNDEAVATLLERAAHAIRSQLVRKSN